MILFDDISDLAFIWVCYFRKSRPVPGPLKDAISNSIRNSITVQWKARPPLSLPNYLSLSKGFRFLSGSSGNGKLMRHRNGVIPKSS